MERSRQAMGRAPLPKISRMIPPIPVAAPWRGSTWEDDYDFPS